MEYLIKGIVKLVADLYYEGNISIAQEVLLNGGCYELIKIIEKYFSTEINMLINEKNDHCVLQYDEILYDASGMIIDNINNFKIPNVAELKYIKMRYGNRVKGLNLFENITKEIEKIGIEEFIKQTIREENNRMR